jgi:pyruvate-ferredoxin/flavodoxin oxidoreductase
MAEKTDEWSALGRKNIFGQAVTLAEMQSEAGAIGALHGALETGAYATSYTSSQGLLLMIPVLHRIAGSRLPAVLHVAARTVGTHAMSIFGDHSDVMNCRQTGFAMLSSASVQEAMDLAAVAHLTAIRCRMPFMHFFDGFRTSHEIQKVDLLDYDDLAKLIDYDAVNSFKHTALNPDHPTLRNTVQNPDVYFQVREANNTYYDDLPDAVAEYMQKINELTGRDYKPFNYYGAPDAEHIIIAMGSVSGAIIETVNRLNEQGGKTGFVQVHLYRPFPVKYLMDAIPESTKVISVLDRTKEIGAVGEPLYQDICAAYTNVKNAPLILGGRYGLSSKDTTPKQIKAVFDNMKAPLSGSSKGNFTIGITDDVTGLSLPDDADFSISSEGTYNCKFWGLGSDGTVGANKNSIKIIGDHAENYVQAYFEYDTKKSFGITRSHLRVSRNPILSSYLVKEADFVACHNQFYMEKYDIVTEIKKGGTFLLNCDYSEERLGVRLPAHVRKYLADNDITFYIINANKIAKSLGLGDRINIVLQAAFFKLFEMIPLAEAVEMMKDAVEKTYKKKGTKIVEQNQAAIDEGLKGLKKIEVPAEWKTAVSAPENASSRGDNAAAGKPVLPPFIENILIPINDLKGDDLPVSAFEKYSDGTMPLGATAFEKRGIATQLPLWDKDKCIQCNRCSFVCPHAVIRPYLLDDEEKAAAPERFETIPAAGKEATGLSYSLQFSDLDCTGCGSCASVCPAKEKALTMIQAKKKDYVRENWEYGLTITEKDYAFNINTVKGTQFKQPLYEFSGACAGCGETPYAKLLTQLYGDRIYWANATGCSQAWGAAMPSIAYTTNKAGHGPAWSNSLFENNAEFSFGMLLSYRQQRTLVQEKIEALRLSIISLDGSAVVSPDGLDIISLDNNEEHDNAQFDRALKTIDYWLETIDDINLSPGASEKLEKLLRKLERSTFTDLSAAAAEILNARDHLAKKTIWMYGGDGWAYDIGYGGLDHVIATGEDLNIFVIDTEVYSNTGGQSSKATPLGAVAQFQSSGKKSPKKNLGKQMMSWGNVYVASVSMGADHRQLLRAITEAESYKGPSVIVAYTPCIVHGIKAGMDKVQEEMKRAVDSGYWPLYRYDPRKEKPFQLDSREQTLSYKDFIEGEVRYSSLEISFPDNAKQLFTQAEQDAERTLEEYREMDEK